MATCAHTDQMQVEALTDVLAAMPGLGRRESCPAGSSARVSLLGAQATVAYTMLAEDERRRAAGLGPITSPDALRPLLGLPVGERVAMSALTPTERSDLASLPAGAVEIGEDFVVRRAVAPLRVDLAVVPARRWRTGLEQAGRFAPFCARAMLLPTLPRDHELMCLDAAYYGIGVIINAPGREPQVLVPPAVFQRRRLTVAGMRFPEEVYRQVR
ncbi:hypothetical protein HUT06_00340 [Actinomadura sp. NAK00032]|uniref:hypothetical protein n=1 Tax=Actinomadura sp. NAK00032 TaxID=2742128 RepID=UPI001590C096|nr:hypothetical protein [Actinomadura sp. NAK00032]QKW32674.1 hypothetical protein HUT06_00340 [Actinomadura sp. NAK00032]